MRQEIREILTKEVVTGKEAKRLFGIDESNLRHKVKRGTVEGLKMGTVWLFDKQDLIDELRAKE